VRADALFDAVAPRDLHSFLSGMLIGAEAAAMRAALPRWRRVTLVCGPPLDALYRAALERHGFSAAVVATETATVAGLSRIADGWLGAPA
jgi:2-dehydro-3-deoxygalactonokinase